MREYGRVVEATLTEANPEGINQYTRAGGHVHPVEEYSTHDHVHRAVEKLAKGYGATISVHDWGSSRAAEVRRVAHMHGLDVTRTNDRSNPMKQHYEASRLGKAATKHRDEAGQHEE